MATSRNNEPVEDTYEYYEYLDEEGNDSCIGPPSVDPSHSAELGIPTERCREQEQQQQIQKLEERLDGLEKDVQKNTKSITNAERKMREAEAYATAMAEERTHIACERDEVILREERLQQVVIVMRRAEKERAAIEQDYQEKIDELRRSHNTLNNTFKMLEEQIKKLTAENDELRKENDFLKATFFVSSPSPDDNQQLKCFSCTQAYSAESHAAEECTFHPLPRVAPSVWHRWEGPTETHIKSEYANYFYWPCCNVLSPKGRRPKGCRRGPHHQKWEMDVIMKRVMLSRDVLDEVEEQQELSVI